MNKIFIVVIVLVAVALGVGIYFFSVSKKGPASNNLPVQENNPTGIITEQPATQVVEVTIKDLAFNPAELQVKIGTEVRWTNQDSMNHTITSTDFSSGEISNGQTYSHVFSAVDIYDYHCSIHPSMTGKITVTP
jgi:plastocyanin